MLQIFDRFERFLRLDRFSGKSELMRARAVYMMGLAFLGTQVINFGVMSIFYDGLSFSHLIAGVVCLLVALNIMTLRSSKNFQLYAFIYSMLIIGATLSLALSQNTGINSALIPFFILGVVVNGFISGWRAAVMFGLAAIGGVWGLWLISDVNNFTPVADIQGLADRNFQRATQASLAIVMITMVVGFFSKSMHEAFEDLEASILTARTSDRAKTDFLATMSHELCTPMNGIIGISGVLENTDLDADQKDLTGIIRDSGKDLQKIIGNVLLFSQLDAGRVILEDEPFSLRNIISDVAARHAASIVQLGLSLEIDIAETVPATLIGDKTRTEQIVEALVNNAVKFTKAGGIKISVVGGADERGHAALLLRFTDTGIGIAETDHVRIFDRFTQEDGSIKRRHGGTGLGLTVARGLAELMGGSINVKSEPDVGSVFTVRLAYETVMDESAAFQAAAE